jgi:hypothetical protein
MVIPAYMNEPGFSAFMGSWKAVLPTIVSAVACATAYLSYSPPPESYSTHSLATEPS